MQYRTPRILAPGLLVLAAMAGCGDLEMLGLDPLHPDAPALASTTTVCETIDFNEFLPGGAVETVAVFGRTISVTAERFPNGSGQHGGSVIARAFETDGHNDDPSGVGSIAMEDVDLQWRGEDWEGSPGGACADCEGLGRILVLPDHRGFVPWGDYIYGGLLSFTGDLADLGLSVRSFKAVDVDENEPGMRLLVDGTQIMQSEVLGNGSVDFVAVGVPNTISSSFAFQIGPNDGRNASGGIDDIELCREIPLGGEGCTLGYWKTHLDSWGATGYAPAHTLEDVFDVPDQLGMDATSLLAALNFGGGSGVTGGAMILLRQAVASLLNSTHPDVSFGMATADVISQVNAALASLHRGTMIDLAEELDRLNNEGCPLN